MKLPFGKEESIENAFNVLSHMQKWGTQAWRIGVMMAKGAYLNTERRRLFHRLGEEVFYKHQKGELSFVDLEPMIEEIQKLTRKIELEEVLIQRQRFGRNQKQETQEYV